MSDSKKTVQIYFYSMDVERKKKSADDTPYSMDAICKALSSLLDTIVKKDLQYKKHDFTSKKKVVWLESVDNLTNGNFNLVFKSAKYDQSREVRNTDTMEERGVLKNPEDGDEEKSHLCLRLRKGAERITAVMESNFYGIGTTDIAAYLNAQFNAIQENSEEQYSYSVSFEIMPSEDFLIELDKMKKINLLRVTMDIKDLDLGDFQSFADRDILRPTVELYIRKKRGKGINIPKNLISTTYQQHKSASPKKQIRKIAVEGANDSGSLKIDTDSIQMKHSIEVETFQPTNEVNTADFFVKASAFITETGV
jgi:hypothetical protein